MLTFDAIGPLIGVCEQAGFMRDEQAMVSDAIGTGASAALGTRTVASFIESADWSCPRRALFGSAVFQPLDRDDRRLSADYRACADDR